MLLLKILAKQEDRDFSEELARELETGNVFNGEKQNPGLALGHYKNNKAEKKELKAAEKLEKK